MTCYFRHIQRIFEKAGIKVTSDNKREIDRVMHSIVDVQYKNCPDTWREVKKIIVEDEERFAIELGKEYNRRIQSE